MSPSVEAQLRARLDFAHPLPLDGLTSYCGCSSLAQAIDTGISRMDKALAQRRATPTRTTPNTRLYAYWTAAEKRQHSERMREYYARRKQALAQARREKRRAACACGGSSSGEGVDNSVHL